MTRTPMSRRSLLASKKEVMRRQMLRRGKSGENFPRTSIRPAIPSSMKRRMKVAWT